MNLPNVLGGSGAPTNWLNGLRAFAASCRLLPGRGYKLKVGPNGTALEIDIQAAAAAASVKMYRLKSVAADYYVCRSWDGTTEGTVNTNIAKPETLRHAAADGAVTFTYTQDSAVVWTRRATVTGQAGYLLQYIEPHFNVNSLIYAIPAQTGVTVSGAAVSLLALADGRMWSQPESDPLI